MNKKFLFLLIALPAIPGCWGSKKCHVNRLPAHSMATSSCCDTDVMYDQECPDYLGNQGVMGCQEAEYQAYEEDQNCPQDCAYDYEPAGYEGQEFVGESNDFCDAYDYDYDYEQISEDQYQEAPLRNETGFNEENEAPEEYLESESGDLNDQDTSKSQEPGIAEEMSQSEDLDEPLISEDIESSDTEDAIEDEEGAKDKGFKEVLFDFGGKKIKAGQEEILKTNLGRIKQLALSGHKIVVEGHSCKPTVSEDNNLKISRKRAESVANYLIENGIDKDNIQVFAQGDKMPLSCNQAEEQSLNRRVEIYSYKEV